MICVFGHLCLERAVFFVFGPDHFVVVFGAFKGSLTIGIKVEAHNRWDSRHLPGPTGRVVTLDYLLFLHEG